MAGRDVPSIGEFLRQLVFRRSPLLPGRSRESQKLSVMGSRAPYLVRERPLHSPKVTVWCAISSSGIIGPLWFEDLSGKAVTINAERYQEVLEEFWTQLQRRCVDNFANQWLQQDGAGPHTARTTLVWLKEHFGAKLVSRKTTREWPAHSPDLSPLDFFFGGN